MVREKIEAIFKTCPLAKRRSEDPTALVIEAKPASPQAGGTRPPRPTCGTGRLAKRARRLAAIVAGVASIAMLVGAGAAEASAYNAQQLRFFDDQRVIYSVYIHGPNQDGTWTDACVPTPNPTTDVANLWWSGHTEVWGHRDSYCGNQANPLDESTGRTGMNLYIDVPGTFDGYYWRCLSDKPPSYSDWSCP